MHKRFVANIVARILLIECCIMLLPLAWALYDNPHSQEVKAFAIAILGGAVLAGAFVFLFHIKKEDFKKINAKDGLAIVGLSWVCLSLLGAAPFCLGGVVPTYTDALFETVSGYTTTGASIFANVEVLPRGILFWRSLTHWLGGIGIIVLYLAILPALGQTALQLFRAEKSDLRGERLDPRIKETAKILCLMYLFLSLVQLTLHLIGDMPFFDALCHMFGTIATGGFSTKNFSLGAFNAYHQWVVILFMFLGGANFLLYYQLWKGDTRIFLKNEEFRFYFYTTFIFIGLFTAILSATALSKNSLRDAAFQVVSILTTTGYITADYDQWPDLLRYALVLLMFVGGCTGSTSGGVKIIRFFLTLKICFRSVVQTLYPNAVIPVKVDAHPLENKIIIGVLSFFSLYILLWLMGGLLLLATEACDIVTAFSAPIAMLSNVGPGLERVGAVQNYGWMSLPGKWILTFLMLAGRLELYPILILLQPSTWKK